MTTTANETVRFGIIGAGVIGAAHAAAVASLPNAEATAIVEVASGAQAGRQLASTYGAHLYLDLHEMLKNEPVDIVIVCTPSGFHARDAIAAIQAGKHVVVEKPMALTLADIDQMLAVQTQTGMKLSVISQHRFDPAAQRVHALADAGQFGQVSLGIAHVPWWRSQAYYDKADWRGTERLDGGVLMNQAIHAIDLLQWFLGPVIRVVGYSGTLSHDVETEDTAVASLEVESGALAAVTATTGAYPGLGVHIEVLGSRGSAVIEDDALTYLKLDSSEASIHPAEQVAPRFGVSHAVQLADMVAAIREDRPPAVDGITARATIQTILAIRESFRTGREVVIA